MSTLQVKTELPFNELLKAVEQLNLPDLEQLMSQVVVLQARRKAPSLPKNESELLLKINQGLPLDVQKRFDELVAKRQAETLTSYEHQELLDLIDRIEKLDAKRVEYMAKLANIREISLSALMEELNIRRPAYA
ncbi:STAS/SEC14 domain-containing protein [Candidatus Electrothrix sp.]|uniref:STAS/SEC14 domain-containing protein n=1 Tax=Candidatus Electrothrix sp. TaxID=2170559 RepID=UPI0040561C25